MVGHAVPKRCCLRFLSNDERHILSLLLALDFSKSIFMSPKPYTIIEQALARIEQIRRDVIGIELVCSGTLLKRYKVCGKPGCRCAQDIDARHGPYFEWGHMQAGKLVHRTVTADQAVALELAIANHRTIQAALKEWDSETIRVIEAESPRTPKPTKGTARSSR